METANTKPKWHIAIIIAILILASVFSFTGLKFSYPYLEHPDEPAITDEAKHLAMNDTWEPQIYNRPNHVSIYINSIAYRVASQVAFGQPFKETAGQTLFYYQVSRGIVAFLSVLLVLAMYLLGKAYSHRVGIFAMLITAVFPLFVQHAHYATPDISITLIAAFTMLACIKYLKTQKNQFIFIMVFLTALGTAEKYPMILLAALPFFSVIYINRKDFKKVFKLAVLAVGAYFVCLFIIAPFLFIHAGTVVNSVLRENRSVHIGADGGTYFDKMLFYITTFFNQVSLVAGVFLVLGAVRWIKDRKGTYLPVLFSALYWLAVSALSLHWERWSLPMMILPILLVSIGLSACFAWVKQKGVGAKIVGYAASGLLFATLLLNSVCVMVDFLLPTTMADATAFVEENGIENSNTFYDGYSPLQVSFPVVRDYGDILKPENKETYEYIILSSGMYDRYYNEAEKYSDVIENIESIRAQNTLIFEKKVVSADDFLKGPKYLDFYNIPAKVKWLVSVASQATYRGNTLEIYKIK